MSAIYVLNNDGNKNTKESKMKTRIAEMKKDMEKYPVMAKSIAQDITRLANELASR
jgi:hypothetical protein